VPLDEQMVCDLAALSCANELDVLRHARDLTQATRAELAALLCAQRPMLGYRAALTLDAQLAALDDSRPAPEPRAQRG